MLASAVVSVATLLVLGIMYLTTLQHDRASAELRMESVPVLTAVRHTLEYLPQHRGMTNAYLHGHKELAAKLTVVE